MLADVPLVAVEVNDCGAGACDVQRAGGDEPAAECEAVGGLEGDVLISGGGDVIGVTGVEEGEGLGDAAGSGEEEDDGDDE